MPRYVLPILILGVVAFAAILTWWTLGRAGSASDTAMADQDIGPFHRIEVNGAADVTLRQGAGEHLSIETPGRGLRVAANVEGGTLTITARDTRRWWQNLFGGARGRRTPKITITFRNLDAVSIAGAIKLTSASLETPELRVEAAGGSTLRIDGLKTNVLRVEADGALKARLAGTATEQHIEIAGRERIQRGRAREPRCDRRRERRGPRGAARREDARRVDLGCRQRRVLRQSAGEEEHQRRRQGAPARRGRGAAAGCAHRRGRKGSHSDP
jgi:hypothetical protein